MGLMVLTPVVMNATGTPMAKGHVLLPMHVEEVKNNIKTLNQKGKKKNSPGTDSLSMNLSSDT